MAAMSKFARLVSGFIVFVLVCPAGRVSARSQTTRLGDSAAAVAHGMNGYAADHNGEAAKSLDDLRPYINVDAIEMGLEAPLRTKMLLLGNVHPSLLGLASGELVGMTSFTVNENRRKGEGRYIVYRGGDRKFAARWEAETTIQKTLAAANLSVAAVSDRATGGEVPHPGSRERGAAFWSVLIIVAAGFAALLLWRLRK